MKFYFIRFFTYLFGRKLLFNINIFLYKFSLYNLGFNNYFCNKILDSERIFIKKLNIKKIKTCIDIGANNGEYSSLILKKTNATVFAIEPQNKCNKYLKNIKKKNNKKFYFFNCALSSSNKNGVFYESNKSGQLSSAIRQLDKLKYINLKSFKKKNIKFKTLDDLLYNKLLEKKIKKIDLIKIDCEGYDFEILKGSKKILKEMAPKIIQIEMNWHHLFLGHNLWLIYNFLNNFYNYSVYRLLPSGEKIEINPSLPENNLFNYSNYVFIKK